MHIEPTGSRHDYAIDLHMSPQYEFKGAPRWGLSALRNSLDAFPHCVGLLREKVQDG